MQGADKRPATPLWIVGLPRPLGAGCGEGLCAEHSPLTAHPEGEGNKSKVRRWATHSKESSTSRRPSLVYHDAMIVSYGARDEKSLLQGLLCGGVPELPIQQNAIDEKRMSLIRAMAKLHERVALLEMTRHEFLDANYRKERTTFADGTSVTVDWNTNSFTINPELK